MTLCLSSLHPVRLTSKLAGPPDTATAVLNYWMLSSSAAASAGGGCREYDLG